MSSLNWLRSRGWMLSVTALGLLAACMEAGRSKPRAGGTLGLGHERASAETPSGPLKVSFAAPEGAAKVVTEVSVVFDRPVRELGAASDGPAPFRVTPEVPGRFRWVGSRAAVFTPERRLPFATTFAVEVPPGLQALDGSRLAAPYRFQLETARPSLLRTTPADDERGLGSGTKLRLELDQAVTPAALKAAATLEQGPPGSGKALAFDVKPDEKQPRALWLVPKRPLPPHSRISLTLAESLRGSEGPLPAGSRRTLSFYTYDPLALQEVSCAKDAATGRCEADSSVALVFNNAVKPGELAGKLHVTPDAGVKLFRGHAESDARMSYLELPGRYQAGQTYEIRIDPGLTDEFGQISNKPLVATIAFRDHRPRVDIGAVGRNFPGRPLSIPVAARNVPAFELLTAPLSPQDLLAWRAAQRSADGRSKELDWLAAFKGTAVNPVRSKVAKNQIERLSVDTMKVLGQSGRGALAIGARYAPDREDYGAPPRVKVLNVSDLGISAKLSRFGSLVWVTDRTSNAPVADATVELLVPGRPARIYTTDADGVARIPASEFAPNLEDESPEAQALLIARRGADSVFAAVSEHVGGYRLDVPTDFSGELRHYGVLFSDRGIYRPGDEVSLKGIVRRQTPTGNAVPAEQAVTLSLRAPSGDQLSSQQVMLTSYGTVSGKLQVPASAELGTYYASVAAFGKEQVLEQSFEVSEYRPVELRVAASSERPSYVRGETAQLELKADYLFGAAAAGLSSTLSVSRQPTWFQVPGAEDFVTNADAFYYDLSETSPAGELRREVRQLDAHGRINWSEKLDLPAQRGTELLRIDAEVTDVSRRSVAGSGSAILHPAAFYLGIKNDDTALLQAPGKVSPRVLALDAAGRHLAGKRVTLELIERRYSFAREQDGDDYRSLAKPLDREVSRCELNTAAEAASCPLALASAGFYLIRARSRDERGNPVEAATSIYAAGPGEPTWQDNDRRRVELVLDRKSYRVGQQARVLVKSPYKEAEALITVERSGVYQAFHRVLRGTAPTFDIPVTDGLLPNAFIAVHLLPRRTGKAPLLEPGSYRIGYANLRVDAEARRLAVRVTPNKLDFRPGESVEVRLGVKDARGLPAANTELTLYAADEGVLSLIDYRTPDPLQVFAGARALQVATLESRDEEGKILLDALSGRDKGRDGGGGGDGDARRDFRQTAYFNPRIITDARGEAKVSFKLPESLSTFRLMAVAVGRDDRYGFSQERVTTSKPLMARPALPRFLRVGDRFEAGVIISKKGLAAGKVRVSAAFTGLSSTVPLSRELEVPHNGSVELRFPAEAHHPGKASVRFEISAGVERDVVTQSLPVALPMAAEAAAVYGQTSDAQSEKLGDLSAVRADTGTLSVSLASTALVGVDQAALDLIDYPYSCTEQLSSRVLPLVALGELSKALGFPLPADAKRRAINAVGELLARQQGDGGFAMWPESGESSPWISPYAALALSRAQRAGVTVPRAALERAAAYLKQSARQWLETPWHLPVAALSLDVQGELGAPDAGAINQLFLRRKELPLFARALLLHAAVGAKLGSDVPATLAKEIERSIHVNGDRAVIEDDAGGNYQAWLDSPARTQALVLRALSARGKHPLLTPLARGLLGLRKQGKFRTTQEGGWALLALDEYRRVAEAESAGFDATLSLGGERLGGASFKPTLPLSQRFELPLSRVLGHAGEPLVFEKRGSGKLFYEARLRYARRELPKQPLDAGFFIEKSLHSVRAESRPWGGGGAPVGIAGQVGAGDLVLVDLTVVTPAARQYVVIDDALPAGLEAIDPKLLTTADWLKDPAATAGGDDEVRPERNFYDRSEVRDDRVLFFADRLPAGLTHYRYLARATTLGRFVLPPTRVEEMYEPEVFGRNGATELVVR